jgi:hypothetical protein
MAMNDKGAKIPNQIIPAQIVIDGVSSNEDMFNGPSI